MIRSNLCVAVAVLSFATSSFAGTPTSLGLTFPSSVSIGTPAIMSFDWGTTPSQGGTLYVYYGTSNSGMTTMAAGNRNVTIPLSGSVWLASTSVTGPIVGTLACMMPNDPALVGDQVFAVAVLVDPNGTTKIVARTGGPVIGDIIN